MNLQKLFAALYSALTMQVNTISLSLVARLGMENFYKSQHVFQRHVTLDIDPIFCEITIRRLEHLRETGKLGWQNSHAFEAELG